MIWLIAQMWVLLLAAFILGLGVGWWVWALRNAETPEAALVPETTALGTLLADAAPPVRVSKPANGVADDLTQIIGLNEETEKKLNEIGIFHLYQIADWGPARIQWIESKLGESGRVESERWVAQARTLRMPNELESVSGG